jgi:hypothetical protein
LILAYAHDDDDDDDDDDDEVQYVDTGSQEITNSTSRSSTFEENDEDSEWCH